MQLCCGLNGTGAGYHSPANCELYKQVCRHACVQVSIIYKIASAVF